MVKRNDDSGRQALAALKSDIRANSLKNLYFFYGEEAFLREHYLSAVRKKLLGGPAEEFNYHRFSSENLSAQALSDAVEAVPMMAERTMIQIDDVDLYAQSEPQREQYRQILSDLPEYCCVIFVYDTVEFKLNGQMRRLTDTIRSCAQCVQFDRQSERDLTDWITRHFRAAGKTISAKLCQYLIFLTDGSMTALNGEIEKTAGFCTGTEITRSDIDAVVIPALNAQTFDISNAIAEGNFDLALGKTQELFAMQEDPITILGAIGAQIRRLHYAKMITGAGKGQQTLMELTGMKSYPAGLTMTAARSVSDEFCKTAVELCLRADAAMKSSRDEPKRILELLIAQLAMEAGHG